MDAAVLAAGEGRRLRPLTRRWPKPILPIDGRPVIATLLRELAVAGCARVFVVTGHLAAQVEELVGDGSGFGLAVRFVRQPSPLGTADAVQRALAAGARPPLLVVAADTVFRPGDLARFRRAAAAPAALALRRRPPPDPPHREAVRVASGRVESLRADAASSELSAAPLWLLGRGLEPFLDGLPGPPYELGEAYERALAAGIPVGAVEIGATRDLTDPLDFVEENFPYLSS